MSAEPWVMIRCDEPGCDAYEMVQAAGGWHGRMALAREKPWALAHPPTYEADWCPKHKPKVSR